MYPSNSGFLGNSQYDNLINRKNLVMSDYNNCQCYDQYGQIIVKPGYEKRYNDCIVELQNLDRQLAMYLQSRQQPQQPQMVYNQQPMQNTARPNIGPSALTPNTNGANNGNYNVRLANGIATNQGKNYSVPVPNIIGNQSNNLNQQQKQTPKVEKPKEKVFINGALPYLDYLVDKNHMTKVTAVADRENTYTYEVILGSKELLDWIEDDNQIRLEDINLNEIDNYQQGTIITNGYLLCGNVNNDVVRNVYSDCVWQVFASMYSDGRKVDQTTGFNTVVSKLKMPRSEKVGVTSYKELKVLGYPMIIVEGLNNLDNKFYRVSRDSHNLLYNKLIGLDMKYPFVVLGEYNPRFSNFTKFIAMKVDEEFGCVNLNTVNKPFVNWLF